MRTFISSLSYSVIQTREHQELEINAMCVWDKYVAISCGWAILAESHQNNDSGNYRKENGRVFPTLRKPGICFQQQEFVRPVDIEEI
jgi:hypothetical protein